MKKSVTAETPAETKPAKKKPVSAAQSTAIVKAEKPAKVSKDLVITEAAQGLALLDEPFDLDAPIDIKTEFRQLKLLRRGEQETRGYWARYKIHMGFKLTRIKQQAPHGTFLKLIEKNFPTESPREVQNLMNVYDQFSGKKLTPGLSYTVLALLAQPSTPQEARDAVLNAAESGEAVTTRTAKEAIAAAKGTGQTAEEDVAGNAAQEAEEFPLSEQERAELENEAANGTVAQTTPVTGAVEDLPTNAAPAPGTVEVIPAAAGEEVPPSTGEGVVVHDSLTEAQEQKKAAELAAKAMSDDDWLMQFAVFRVLKDRGGKGINARRILLDYRKNEKPIKAAQHHAARMESVKSPSADPFSRMFTQVASLPEPGQWQIHGPCKGDGCKTCGHSGLDFNRTGISPDAVEQGTVDL